MLSLTIITCGLASLYNQSSGGSIQLDDETKKIKDEYHLAEKVIDLKSTFNFIKI